MLREMSSVRSSDGTQIAFRKSGAGPPLVLVHGSVDDHTCWTGLLQPLEEHFTVYALDRRGYGDSRESETREYAIERECEDILALVDMIDGSVNILGHSYGALCAVEVALRAENLNRVILYEPPFGIDPSQRAFQTAVIERFSTLLDTDDREGAALVFVREIARLPEHENAAVRSTPAWQVVLDSVPNLPRELDVIEDYRFSPDRFERLTTPILLLLGSESPPFLKAATNALAAALPNGRLVVLEGQGHLAMHTSPDLFLHEVIQFHTED